MEFDIRAPRENGRRNAGWLVAIEKSSQIVYNYLRAGMAEVALDSICGRAWGLVAPLDFKSSTASDEGAGWVRFPHPPATVFPW